jgi:hypothetical protein
MIYKESESVTINGIQDASSNSNKAQVITTTSCTAYSVYTPAGPCPTERLSSLVIPCISSNTGL